MMKLEDFLFEYLTNFLEFEPNRELEQAIHDYVYQGKFSDIKPFDRVSIFKNMVEQGTEIYLEHLNK